MYYYVDYKVIDLIKVYETINGVLHKRCSICKAVKPVSEYSPAGNKFQAACKVCRAAYEVERTQGEDERRKKREREQRRRDSEEGKRKIKEYNSRPEVIKKSREYAKIHNKEYYSKPENREKIKHCQREYYVNNKEKIRHNYKQWASKPENKERLKKYTKDYLLEYYKDPEKREMQRARGRRNDAKPERRLQKTLRMRERYPEIKDHVNELRRARRKDPAQREKTQEADAKHAFKRRGLGFRPINKNFKGAVKHHLRYTNDPKYKDNDIVIHIPKELHVSIPHNGNTGKGMAEINTRALEWYFNNTPAESRDKQAIKLYWTYLTHPAPVWRTKKEKSQD